MEPVKFLKGTDDVIEGLAIPFGGPFAGPLVGGRDNVDLDGDAFTKSTDFAFEWFPDGRPVIYEHGLDRATKTVVSGRQTEHELIDEGVWAKAQLDRSARYFSTITRLIKQGKLFFSSGAMPHLVEQDRSTKHINRWPWVELSLTTTPANLMAAPHFTKASDLIDRLAAVDIGIPADLVAAALKAIDDDFTTEDDDGLPAGLKFADASDRLLADTEGFRDRIGSLVELRAKSGRVLSAATRDRLARHPGSLRELADDLDALLTDADAGKSTDIDALRIETERLLSRSLGVII